MKQNCVKFQVFLGVMSVITIVLLGLMAFFVGKTSSRNFFTSVLPLEEELLEDIEGQEDIEIQDAVEGRQLSACEGTEQASCEAITDSATCENAYVLYGPRYLNCKWRVKRNICRRGRRCLVESPEPEICDNGQDDDGDGSADCSDSDCEGQTCAEGSICTTEVCTPLCGNGQIDAGEQCDGEDLGEATCQAHGYVAGDLSCDVSCQFDMTACTNYIFASECLICGICGGEEGCSLLSEEICETQVGCTLGGYKSDLGSTDCYSDIALLAICEEEVVEEIIEEPEEVIEEPEEVIEEPEEVIEEPEEEEEEEEEEELEEEIEEEPEQEEVEELEEEIIEEPEEEEEVEVVEEPEEEELEEEPEGEEEPEQQVEEQPEQEVPVEDPVEEDIEQPVEEEAEEPVEEVVEEPVEDLSEEELVFIDPTQEELIDEPVEELDDSIEEEPEQEQSEGPGGGSGEEPLQEETAEEPIEEEKEPEEIIDEDVLEELIEEPEDELTEEEPEEPVEEVIEEPSEEPVIEGPQPDSPEEPEEPSEEIVMESAPPISRGGGGGSSNRQQTQSLPEEKPIYEEEPEVEEAEVESLDSVKTEEIALENKVLEIKKALFNKKMGIVKEAVYVEGVEDPEFVGKAEFSLFETLKVIKPGLEFEDTEEHWSKEYVDFVSKLVAPQSTESDQAENQNEAEKKIIGRPLLEDFAGEEFKPDLETNRVQFTKLALRIFGYGIPDECPATDIKFIDVSHAQCDEAAKVIYRGVEAGFIQGYPDGTFKPTRPVNRAEAFKILFAASGKKEIQSDDLVGLSESSFSDVEIDAWYGKYILYGHLQGILEGDESGYLYPGSSVTRADTVKMIAEIIWNLE